MELIEIARALKAEINQRFHHENAMWVTPSIGNNFIRVIIQDNHLDAYILKKVEEVVNNFMQDKNVKYNITRVGECRTY